MYAAFWLLILGMFSGLIVNQASRYNQIRDQLNHVEAEIAREVAIYEHLRLQIDFFDSDAYIERLAREQLGMVRPNEIVFRNRAVDN